MKQLLRTGLMILSFFIINASKSADIFTLNKFKPATGENVNLGLIKTPLSTKPMSRMFLPASEGEYGMGKQSAFISLAAPGVGLYLANKQYFSLILLPVCYGLVGAGTANMLKGRSDAKEAYAKYLIEKSPTLQNDYIDQAEVGKQKNASGAKMLVGGLVIWGAQTVWTFIYGSYNDKYRARDAKWKNTMSFHPSGGYDFRTNTATMNLNIKF